MKWFSSTTHFTVPVAKNVRVQKGTCKKFLVMWHVPTICRTNYAVFCFVQVVFYVHTGSRHTAAEVQAFTYKWRCLKRTQHSVATFSICSVAVAVSQSSSLNISMIASPLAVMNSTLKPQCSTRSNFKQSPIWMLYERAKSFQPSTNETCGCVFMK